MPASTVAPSVAVSISETPHDETLSDALDPAKQERKKQKLTAGGQEDSIEAASEIVPSVHNRMPCSRGTTFGQPDGSAFPVSCESLSAAPSQRKDRYRDACVSEPATPDSDVPPLCEAPPAFDKEREDAQGYNSTLPSPETSKTLQNKAKAEFSFWMKSMDRSELQQNKLAEVIRTARYHPPPSWRRSATPSSISSTVSCSPPPELPPRRENFETPRL